MNDESDLPRLEPDLEPTQESGPTAPLQPDPPKAPEGYTLLQRLGTGGMGEVWLAEQHSPVRRKVAIKFVRAGHESRDALARFESERQALALMGHASISSVHQAGRMDDGRPFFVMEYVHGPSLTTYCDEAGLSVRARLELFLQVCAGIQHAHQKGIIHRDLKPANVLVVETPEGPRPKIIDFGIAKALDRHLTDETFETMVGDVVGTPQYMSPEQADPRVQDIDTRTDVYSLGVLLYQLLSGSLPFVDEDGPDRPSFHEVQRRVLEEEPRRPSTRVTGGGATGKLAAERRAVDETTLRKALVGDLDWIVMRTLSKDRERRYGSADDLAADIRRHLADEPVEAGPPSLTYRTRKFVRRHRLGVSAAGVVCLVLALGVAGTARGFLKARDEAETADQALSFLVELFEELDSSRSRGARVTVKEALERGSRKIDHELAEQPLLRARLEDAMGRSYAGLGLYEPAETLLARALDGRERVLGAKHEQTLASRHELGTVLLAEGRYPEAEAQLVPTLEERKRILGEGHEDTLDTMEAVAGLRRGQARMDESRALLEAVIAIRSRLQGEEAEPTLRAGLQRAWLDHLARRYDESERATRRLFEASHGTLGEDQPTTLHAQRILAASLMELGRFDESLSMSREGIELSRRVHGDLHPFTLAWLNNLAGTYDRAGRREEAAPIYKEAIEGQKQALGAQHPHTARTMMNYASMLRNEGFPEEAGPLFVQVLESRRSLLGEDHPDTEDIKGVIGHLYWEVLKQPALAEPYYRECLAWHREHSKPTAGRTRGLLHHLGRIRIAQGDLDEGERLLDESALLLAKVVHAEHPDLPFTDALRDALLGREESALALLADADALEFASFDSLSDWAFDDIRDDPRFQAFEARVKVRNIRNDAAIAAQEQGKSTGD